MEAAYLAEWRAYIRYEDLPGAEPALVFVPGSYLAGSPAFTPAAASPDLAHRRRIIVDLLGGGYSDRPATFGYSLGEHAATVAALLDRLEVTGAELIGHSLGGSVATLLAVMRPDLVARLILLEANLDPGGGSFSRFVTGYLEDEFVAKGHADLLASYRERAARDAVAATAVGLFAVADPRGLHRSCVSLVAERTPTIREVLYRLAVPRAYIFGERSLPDADHEALPEHGVAVAVVPEAGHGMTQENPAGLARVVAGLLRR